MKQTTGRKQDSKNKRKVLFSLLVILLLLLCIIFVIVAGEKITDSNNAEENQVETETVDGSFEAIGNNVEKSIVSFMGYTGYMDECMNWLGYDDFIGCDYDNDGLIDRVYRWLEGDDIYYRIEFGNGDKLEFEYPWGLGAGSLSVQAVDFTGDGQNEIVFTQNYEYSTNPMAFGELAVCEKEGNTYKCMDLPFAQEGYSQMLTFSYEKEGEQSLRITCEEAPLDITVPIEEILWNEGRYSEYSGESYKCVVWNVKIDNSNDEKPKLLCSAALFDKWSVDEVTATVIYSEGALIIENITYPPKQIPFY